ncbi:vacuolar membrane-associated protein iml1, partial [Coemansia sp. RSA 990]
MPLNNQPSRNHVSIFDRRGQKPGRGRSPKSTGDQPEPALFNKVCMLRVHEESFSTHDLALNPAFFPGIRIGDIVAIKLAADSEEGETGAHEGSAAATAAVPGAAKASTVASTQTTQGPYRPSRWLADDGDTDDNRDDLLPDIHREIILQVSEVRRDMQQIQASISNHAMRTLWTDQVTSQRVSIRKIDLAQERESIRADFVEIAFRDQYVGRSDMWRLWRNLNHKVVRNNQTANMEGLIRASVRRIYKNGADIACGFIDGSTQPIFRSESGRFILFLQMSEEMWAYQEDGHLCYEKALAFLGELFKRWSDKQLNHMVTIVMFSRWYYHQRDCLFFPDLVYDKDSGRYYRDYYKVIADMEVRADWSVILPEILAEFHTYRRDIQELHTAAGVRLRGDLSKAHHGNILEAVNLGINSFSSNYVDRDLARTGLSTVVVTPSFGVFDVSKRLLRMTTERMLHFGTRVDFVCLAPRPLFRPPVFRFKSYPVPSEQEQRRVLSRIAQIKHESSLAESPGQLKDRTMSVPKTSHSIAVDPLMLDPLYFDDEKWINELIPLATGVPPRRTTAESCESQLAASIFNTLLKDATDVPDSIRECFGQAQSKSMPDNRVVYHYFAYWVDSGFYSYMDQSGFTPCKMGDLPVTGIADYMRQRPMIPDLVLNADTTSMAGYPSGSDSIKNAIRERGTDAQTPNAHNQAAMFAHFDQQAIIGVQSSLKDEHSHMEDRFALGHIPTPFHLSQYGAKATWEEQSQGTEAMASGADQARMLTSPSPNLQPSQSIVRTEHGASVPSKISNPMAQRTTGFGAGKQPSFGLPKQASDPLYYGEMTNDYQRHSIAGSSPLYYAGTRTRGLTPDAAGKGSPQSVEYGLGSVGRGMSHLEDQVRTYDVISTTATHPHGQESGFQLTMPTDRQQPVSFRGSSQPSAPPAPDYHSGSPHYSTWMDRLSTHGPDSGASRTLRMRSYGPYNPCNPEMYPLPHTELSQRWAFAFPTYASLSSYTPKWRSLCTPASLPLVTDYHPTDLDSFYQHSFYHITTPDIRSEDLMPMEDYDEFSQFMTLRAPEALARQTDAMRRTDQSTFIMLKEMVYQRLAQGFQFINLGSSTGPRRDALRMHSGWWSKQSGRSEANARNVSRSPHFVPPSAMFKSERAIWLSNGRQIQKLEFHDSSSTTPGVLVTWWKRNKHFDQSDVHYQFQMWTRNNIQGYCSSKTRFSYSDDEDVNWNKLDYLIPAYPSNSMQGMKYWRTRYVLIPVGQLSNDKFVKSGQMSTEDIRIANFEKFLGCIIKVLRKDERRGLECKFLGTLPSELRRPVEAVGTKSKKVKRGMFPPLPQSMSMREARKTVGLDDLIPSSLLQIRYTSLYPVPYLANELTCYMGDSTYLDPNIPISLPPPASLILGGLMESVNVESPFAQLAYALQHQVTGVGLRNIRWHFGYFKNAFLGSQLVDWILVNFDSVRSRSQAVTAGNRLMDRGLICSVHRPGHFLDGHYFYKFTEDAIKCKSHSAVKSQSALMGLSRYESTSATVSPNTSRPESRQGNNSASQLQSPEATNTPKARQESLQDLPSESALLTSSELVSSESTFEYQKTPDIFPLQQHSQRPLPKVLKQSRAFALDLDLDGKSSRIEQCLVHVDAVQNPTTCFHLSINWLNCTNHLIDELVREWGQMAEHCGMRLVEAPRAQDIAVDACHPFHSPVQISLEMPPPHVSKIFDEEWISEFDFFGEDSEERRQLILERMAQCIPTYPFERQLLEEQDFVLDVEAESNYPKSSLLTREYTYDRVGHEHTQYVHRSGTAFVQICGPGQFLWLNNYLYTSHQSHSRPPPPPATAPGQSTLSQINLSAYGARSDPTSVVAGTGSTTEASSASTPINGRQLGRLAHSSSNGGRGSTGNANAAESDGYSIISPTDNAAPVYYPTRQVQKVWPHQIIPSLSQYRTLEQKLELSDAYLVQIVDRLGELPATFDSVNAAVTRVAVMRSAAATAND